MVNQTDVTTGETPNNSRSVDSHTITVPSISTAPSIYTTPDVYITTTPALPDSNSATPGVGSSSTNYTTNEILTKTIKDLTSKVIQTDVKTGETSKNSTDVDSHTTTSASISEALTNSTAP